MNFFVILTTILNVLPDVFRLWRDIQNGVSDDQVDARWAATVQRVRDANARWEASGR